MLGVLGAWPGGGRVVTAREAVLAVLGAGAVLIAAGAAWWAVARVVQGLALLAALAAAGGS